jgi:D-alanyl-D-alanine dipeptidase
LDLAALAFLACSASSADPLEFDELERRYLPESPVRGNAAHQKRRYALTAAVLIASGVEPEDTSWWKADNLWSYAFDAVVVFVRAASERRQLPIATICTALRDQS